MTKKKDRPVSFRPKKSKRMLMALGLIDCVCKPTGKGNISEFIDEAIVTYCELSLEKKEKYLVFKLNELADERDEAVAIASSKVTEIRKLITERKNIKQEATQYVKK